MPSVNKTGYLGLSQYTKNEKQTMGDYNSDMSKIDAATAKKVTPNLLINWDFLNPVNQQGQSSYTGMTGYAIDMWKSSASSNILGIVDDGISLQTVAVGQTFYTVLEKPSKYVGKTLTASINIHSGSARVYIVANSTVFRSEYCSRGVVSVTCTIPINTTQIEVGIQNSNAEITIVKSIKLEPGTVSTLADDPPANYAQQLALCQRYQTVIPAGAKYPMVNYASHYFDFFIPFPVSMRIRPNIVGNLQVKSIDGLTTYDGFTFVSVGTNNPTGLIIRAEKTSHGYVSAFINIPDGITLDSNL